MKYKFEDIVPIVLIIIGILFFIFLSGWKVEKTVKLTTTFQSKLTIDFGAN